MDTLQNQSYGVAIGNVNGFIIDDMTPPDTTIMIQPNTPTNATDASFEFNGSDVVSTPENLTFECQLDGGGFIPCSSPQNYSSLSEGNHTFEVKAIDEALNSDSTPASFTWMIDLTPPVASATVAPAANGNGWNNSDVTVTFSGNDTLSGIDFCNTPVVLSGEGAGQSASGSCTDLAGNVSTLAVASGINIDKTAPIPVHGGPFLVNEGGNLSLDGTASTDTLSGIASTAWALDEDSLFDDSDPASFNGIDGLTLHPVSLKVIDLAGNETIADSQVMVNNVAPTIDGIVAPFDPIDINDQPVSFIVEFSDPGTADTHDVTWDWGDDSLNDTQLGVTSPHSQNHPYVEAGVYIVAVTVTDDDGDLDTTNYEFIVVYDPDGGVCYRWWLDMVRVWLVSTGCHLCWR